MVGFRVWVTQVTQKAEVLVTSEAQSAEKDEEQPISDDDFNEIIKMLKEGKNQSGGTQRRN